MSEAVEGSYGIENSSFIAAGEEGGISALVDDFYDIMRTEPRFKRIYEMHPPDNNTLRDKLARFLCGWMGGPKRFQEKHGPISIPGVHRHLAIGKEERDLWLRCMSLAIDKQDYEDPFKSYLIEQLSVPAEIIYKQCSGE